MLNTFERVCKSLASAAISGLVSVVQVPPCVAQQIAEQVPESKEEPPTPEDKINQCSIINFDKIGLSYSDQGSAAVDDVFQGQAKGCLEEKIAALKQPFLYRYWQNPSDVPRRDLDEWRRGCKSHCDWLQSNNNIKIKDRATWGAERCVNVSTAICDANYKIYVDAWETYKKELPLLSAAEYMDPASTACSGNKCSDALAACKIRCEQMLPRQCYWQSWCTTSNPPTQQLGFCSSQSATTPCSDRVYADDSAVEQFMNLFFGSNQWPSGETDTVRCHDSVPLAPSDDWKSANCAGISGDACEAKYRQTFSHLRGRCATGSFALNKECNLLTHEQARGCVNPNAVAVHWAASSPISLIWDTGTSLRDSASIVNFKLDDSSADTWYRWYGSAKAPLLVYDPRHSGGIESAHQLFGNWTFGGQRVASLALGMTKPKPWSNGYEALETLDHDGSGVISGEELAPLALWFDENRDARAQEGEVRDIRATGVISLAVGPQKRDSLSGDVSVDKGFERLVDGRIEIGRTIDWFSDGAPTMQQLVLSDQMRLPNSLTNSAEKQLHSEGHSEDNQTLGRLPDFSDPRGDYASESKVSGVWIWGSKDQTDLSSHQGMIAIRERKDGRLEILTLGELGVRDSAGVARALQKYYLMTGSVTKGADGSIKIAFKDPHKNTSESVAILDEHSGVLRGETTQRVAETKGTTSIKYSWEARKALR